MYRILLSALLLCGACEYMPPEDENKKTEGEVIPEVLSADEATATEPVEPARIVNTLECSSGEFDLIYTRVVNGALLTSSLRLKILYNVSTFYSGDVFIAFTLYQQDGVSLGWTPVSNYSLMYPAKHPDAATAASTLDRDFTGKVSGGFWKMAVNWAAKSLTITYTDPEVSLAASSWTGTCTSTDW